VVLTGLAVTVNGVRQTGKWRNPTSDAVTKQRQPRRRWRTATTAADKARPRRETEIFCFSCGGGPLSLSASSVKGSGVAQWDWFWPGRTRHKVGGWVDGCYTRMTTRRRRQYNKIYTYNTVTTCNVVPLFRFRSHRHRRRPDRSTGVAEAVGGGSAADGFRPRDMSI